MLPFREKGRDAGKSTRASSDFVERRVETVSMKFRGPFENCRSLLRRSVTRMQDTEGRKVVAGFPIRAKIGKSDFNTLRRESVFRR